MDAEGRRGDLGDALGRAMRLRVVSIKPYNIKTNFTQWLGLLRERVRAAQDIAHGDVNAVNTAVVRVMSQHMDVEALACYNDLADEVKNDYNRMTTELKAVFGDPSERQNFINNRGKTRREKGEKIKTFARRVQVAIETNMPELQDDAAGAPNRRRPKELEGVNRFMKGIRNKAGKKDDNLDEHMKYQLFDDEDKTWQNAIRVAARWEAAKDKLTASSSSSESSSDDTSSETT